MSFYYVDEVLGITQNIFFQRNIAKKITNIKNSS
jgi:hypothetical protein